MYQQISVIVSVPVRTQKQPKITSGSLLCLTWSVIDMTHTDISNSSKLLVKSVLEISGSGGREQQDQRDLPSQGLPKPACVPCQSNVDPAYNAKLAQTQNIKTRFFCVSGTAENSRDFARPFNHSLLAVSSSALPRKQPFTVAPDELHPAAKAACAKISPTHSSASKKSILSVYFIVFWWDGPDLSNYVSRFY